MCVLTLKMFFHVEIKSTIENVQLILFELYFRMTHIYYFSVLELLSWYPFIKIKRYLTFFLILKHLFSPQAPHAT